MPRVDRLSRLWWSWRSAWRATLIGLGLRRGDAWSRGIAFRWSRPGPPPDLSKLRRPVWLQPDDEIGVAAGTRAILATGERFAIALVDCVGYSTGFEFTISYRSRDEMSHKLLGIGMAPGSNRQLEVRVTYPGGERGSSAEHGTEAINAHYEASYVGREPPLPSGPIVMPKGGGGGGKRFDYSYWCWPLPPEGLMSITVEWIDAGISPTTVEIDASAIRLGGLKSKKLWTE